MNHKVSIIMSVFNADNYLSSAIKSVLEQTYSDFEFIIVDDGSSDNSNSIIESFSENDGRMVFVKNAKNIGLASSLNTAWKIANYELIVRMDADDICEANGLKIQLDYMLTHPEIDILGGNATLIDMDSNIVGKTDVPLDHNSIVKALEYRNPMNHPTIMMKRKVLESLGGYDDKLRKAQDLDLWHRAAKAGFRFANLPDCLIQYRVDLDKPTKTILKGFWVSMSYAIKNRSLKGIGFSVVDLIKYFLIKFKLYTPRSLRNKV